MVARPHREADETIATGRADAATARSAASVATARESTRDFLERLVHPIAPEAAGTVVLVVFRTRHITDEMLALRLRTNGDAAEQIQPDLPIPTDRRKGENPSLYRALAECEKTPDDF